MPQSADDEKRLLGFVRLLLGSPATRRGGAFRTQLVDYATTATSLSTSAVNFVIVVCSALKLYLDPPEETEKASQVAFLMTVSVVNAMKGISMVQQRARLRKVVAWMLVMRAAVTDGTGARHAYARGATVVGNVWLVLTLLLGIVWAVDPIFNQPPQLNGTSPDPAMPLSMWLPLDLSAPFTFRLMFMLEAVVCGWTIFFVLCIDLLYVTLILNFAAELRVLNHNVQTTGYGVDIAAHQKRKMGVVHHADTSPDRRNDDDSVVIPNISSAHFTAANTLVPGYTPEHFQLKLSEGNAMYRLLVKNIQHHQLIIRCVNEFEKATALPVLMVVFINVLNLCSNIISLAVLLEEDPRVPAVAKSLIFIMAVTSQTALYCLPGQMIIDESERLAHSAFSCRWPDADGPFKSALLILLVRARQPLCLRVGKLVTISRESFQELLKLSYQLFNLVYQCRAPRGGTVRE